MRKAVEIENIEEMRRQEGIDDDELREHIRRLAVGDLVRLTLLTGATRPETVTVRITDIDGMEFRGRLASQPRSAGLAKLRLGSRLVFTAAHIHSLAKGRPPHAR
jgi:hypothetical protein